MAKTVKIVTMIEPSMKAKLDALSAKHGAPVGEIVRRALEASLKGK